jgi:hypothetical protein
MKQERRSYLLGQPFSKGETNRIIKNMQKTLVTPTKKTLLYQNKHKNNFGVLLASY